MNKAELVQEVADQTGLARKLSREAVDAIILAISNSLARGERVTLVGFGTFQVRERKARKGVNPQTRQAITIPAKKVPKFKPGKRLKEPKREGEVKKNRQVQIEENNKMAKGTIRRLMRDRGYGFITTEDGKDIFFHRTALRDLRFDSLKEGQPVEFEVEEGSRGPRAVNIRSSEKTAD